MLLYDRETLLADIGNILVPGLWAMSPCKLWGVRETFPGGAAVTEVALYLTEFAACYATLWLLAGAVDVALRR